MSAVLFGSISTVADTSELQRQAFNEAFVAHGLDWQWDQDDYAAQLEKSGGQDRIAEFARERGEEVDAAAVHRSKSEIFQNTLATSDLTPRPGVLETIEAAREQGVKLALVTSTSPVNVDALLAGLRSDIDRSVFDVLVDSSQVEHVKPEQDAYDLALERLGESAGECVAIEDNLGGVQAATAAGVACVAFPNQNTQAHSFDQAVGRVDHLDLAELRRLAVESADA